MACPTSACTCRTSYRPECPSHTGFVYWHTSCFFYALCSLQDLIPPGLPIVSVSKGIEVTTGQLMSEVIPSVLGKKQPTVYLSGAMPMHWWPAVW